uniref:hypothetical protein n=1 Tax=Streptosporangium sp. CA-235898 TaxID=3240073 RepID=UPI003F4985D5
MAIDAGKLPIYLRTGATDELEIGHVEVPLTSSVTNGAWTLSVDMPELKHRMASVLREAADVMEDA